MRDDLSPSEILPNARFNFLVLAGDVSFFVIGSAFLDAATALPEIVRHLGGGLGLLGILGAIRQGAYYLPQLFVAHRLQSLTRYKPTLLVITFCGRIGYFAAAALIALFGKTNPALGLGALVVAYTLAWLGDGGGGVPWTALVGRTVPARRRGALFATTQIFSSVGKFAVGWAVTLLLSGKVARFPVAEGSMVLGCAIGMAVSWIFLALIREPARSEEIFPTHAPSFMSFLRTLPIRLRERPDFARLAAVQVLATASIAAAPFLWEFIRAATPGGLPASDAGKFLIAQTAGLMVFAPIWGMISDRMGPKQTLSYLLGVSLLPPLLAYGGFALGGNIIFFYAAYFVLGGVVENWVTITNYLLESVPEDAQPTYIGLMNAVSLPALLLPLLAGLCAQSFGPGAALQLGAILLGIGLAIARTLPDTRLTV